ncbi:MAG TPA: hypothetical protein VF132_00370, partial [Rudaea sp.]
LMRIDSNGRFDTTFGPAHTGIVTTTLGAAGENSAVTGVAIDRAGHILAGGVLYSLRATSMSLVRYTTDGNPDTTFGIGGVTFVSATPPNRYRASALVLDASNRIVLGGYGYEHAEYEFATARFGN